MPIDNSTRKLKDCPFCGEIPELPSGDGTQYDIECNCGHSSSSIQISDYMTIEERGADTWTDYRYDEEFVERAKLEAIKNWNTRSNKELKEVRKLTNRGAGGGRLSEDLIGYDRAMMTVRLKINELLAPFPASSKGE